MHTSRRVLAASALLCAALLTIGAEAASSRTETRQYNYVAADAQHVQAGTGVRFQTERHERFVTLEVVDAVSTNLMFDVLQDRDGDLRPDAQTRVCGLRADRIPISGGAVVEIRFVWSAPPSCDGKPNVITTGTVMATFS